MRRGVGVGGVMNIRFSTQKSFIGRPGAPERVFDGPDRLRYFAQLKTCRQAAPATRPDGCTAPGHRTMPPKKPEGSSQQLKVTDMFRPVTQAVAQDRVDAGAARDRLLWDEQAAERKQLEEQLAAHKAARRALRVRRARDNSTSRRQVGFCLFANPSPAPASSSQRRSRWH